MINIKFTYNLQETQRIISGGARHAGLCSKKLVAWNELNRTCARLATRAMAAAAARIILEECGVPVCRTGVVMEGLKSAA